MEIIKKLEELFKKNASGEKDLAGPEELCPNCWGREEYGGKFYEAVFDNDSQFGWITAYYEKHLKSIQLVKKDETLICPKCKTPYRDLMS